VNTYGIAAAETFQSRQSYSLVVIDDSVEDLYSLNRLLRRNTSRMTFEIREAETGARGLEMCRERMPDCLLLDYSLNDTDGISLLAELNIGRDPDNDPVCPVVVITGANTIAQVAVNALKGGAQDYLAKEILTSEAIVRAIKNAIEKVLLRRAVREAEARFRLSLDNMLDSFGIYNAIREPVSNALVDFSCEYLNVTALREINGGFSYNSAEIQERQMLSSNGEMRLFDEYVSVVETGNSLDTTDYDFFENGVTVRRAVHRRVWKMGDGFAVVWRDITVLTRNEDNLRDVQRELEVERANIALRQKEVSETVQRSLLLAPLPNEYPGLTVQLFYQSAYDEALVGGDFFDAFRLSDGLVALVVGDATGKGVESATYTAEVKFVFRAFLREHNGNLPVALGLLNDFMLGNRHADSRNFGFYVALSAAVVNTDTGSVSCCCAGGEPPLILRAVTGCIDASCDFGSLLGASRSAVFPATLQHLAKGDLVAITSDGITETRRQSSRIIGGKTDGFELLGADGLAEVLRDEGSDPGRDLAELERAVIKRVLVWEDGDQRDDICLLLARRS
jgi:serine phosphatase RsbU (regulator of sigma subunit)/CheY-like chemotaxis protein